MKCHADDHQCAVEYMRHRISVLERERAEDRQIINRLVAAQEIAQYEIGILKERIEKAAKKFIDLKRELHERTTEPANDHDGNDPSTEPSSQNAVSDIA